MDLTIKNIDVTKTNVNLKHEYVIDTPENLKEKEPVSVICTWLKTGEISAYYKTDGESSYIDMRALFNKHVKEIKNLTVNGVQITLPEQYLRLPNSTELNTILSNVGSHIISGYDLTDDEVKNSD